MVAALDHSEVVAAELGRKDGETDEQKAARVEAWIANRVPDIRFLLDHLLNDTAWGSEAKLDPARIGIVGHSFGGWTALAATEVERRICAVVAPAHARIFLFLRWVLSDRAFDWLWAKIFRLPARIS